MSPENGVTAFQRPVGSPPNNTETYRLRPPSLVSIGRVVGSAFWGRSRPGPVGEDMGLRGRAMGYHGIETQERIYEARTAAEVVGRAEDQLSDTGWVPLARERRSDGSLRVIYERLPDEADRRSPDVHR